MNVFKYKNLLDNVWEVTGQKSDGGCVTGVNPHPWMRAIFELHAT
jgi:hypothetical protein